MVVLNHTGEEISAKIVYYGPGLSGKTSNLDLIHKKMPSHAKGEMVSMKTRTDRTLFFDFLPIELGEINGYPTRFLMYTVPGQVYYNATRKLVLKGVDAVVFVADSSAAKMAENLESLHNLEDNLNELGLSLDHVPWVMQYNKRDLPDALSLGELHGKLNLLGVPAYEAVAHTGAGVYETFQGIAGLLYRSLKARLESGEAVDRMAPGDDPITIGLKDDAASRLSTTVPAPEIMTVAEPRPEPLVVETAVQQEVLDDAIDTALREVDGERETPAPTFTPRTPAATPQPEAIGPAERRVRVVDPIASYTPGERIPARVAESTSTDTSVDTAMFRETDGRSVDNDVGRALEFDDVSDATSTDAESDSDGFITDPMAASAPAPRKAPPPLPKLPPMPAAEDDPVSAEPLDVAGAPVFVETDPVVAALDVTPVPETIAVTVPVVLTRSQLAQRRPIRLLLEIEVVED